MSKRTFQIIHFTSTLWLIMCIGYILVLSLRQANVSWWVIFSLSGHSILLVYLLVSLYLFAVFRGIASSKKPIEHPLTSTEIYKFFYNICPFMGFLAGLTAAFDESRISHFILINAMGTLIITFLVWIIIDPILSVAETLCPESRKLRAQRLIEEKAIKQKQEEGRKAFLADILAKDEFLRKQQADILMPKAEKMVGILVNGQLNLKAKYQIIEIGVYAWTLGGLNAMKQLHELTIDKCQEIDSNLPVTDLISVLWDGIGNWRNRGLV